MAAPFTPTIVCPILIGRASQLDALVQQTEQALGGHGRMVLVTGEAGIGKSRLVAELQARLTPQPQVASGTIQILEGHCFEPDAAFPYAPLLDALRAFLATRPTDDGTSVGRATAELVTLLPELGGAAPDFIAQAMVDPQREKRRLFQALTRVFLALTATRPVLLLIEDVHWSDETSLDYLLSLARALASHPLLLLLTYRSDEVQPALARFLAEVERAHLASELALSRLGGDEVATMLRAIFPLSRPLPADFCEAIFALTEGNPFFIEEVLKALITAGGIYYAYGTWSRKPLDELKLPRTIQLAIQRRVDQVSQEARDLLAVLAVAGRRCDFTLLHALLPHDERTLLQLLKELLAAQLVVEEADEVFAFRHALTRQAVYTGLLARERRSLHQTVATTMERLYGATIEAHVDELAYHCYRAGDWTRTYTYAQRAADKAVALFAPRVALDHLSHALEAAHHLAAAPPLGLYRARAQVYETLGEFEHARRDYEHVLRVAGQAGDQAAAWQSLLDLGDLWTAGDYQQAGKYFQQAITQARALGEPALLAQTLNRVGNWHANLDRPLEGLRYHQEARGIFERLADRRGVAETLDFLGTSSLAAAQVLAGVDYYRQAIPLLRALDDRQRLVSSLGMATMGGVNYLSSTAVWLTSGADSIAFAEEALTLARQIGWRAGEAFALVFLGLGLGLRGDYGRAYQCADTSLDIAAEIEHGLWKTFAQFLLGSLAQDLLDAPAARRHLAMALDLARETGSLFWCRISAAALARTCRAQGDIAQATTLLQDDTRQIPPTFTMAQRIIWCARAELDLTLNHPARALEILDALIAAAQVEPGGVIPPLWHLRAQALLALARADEAASVLQAACTTAEQQGTRALLWRVWATIGKLAQAHGQRKQAAAAFFEGRLIVENLAGGIPDEQRRASFLRAALAHLPRRSPPTPRQLAKQAAGGLTEREREVLALVARGTSNRGIATVLVVSERTVEKHVERIMAKLGMSARAQLAAWAVERGIATSSTA